MAMTFDPFTELDRDGEGIDSEKITAHYDNGVLSELIPVSERAKPRRIEVSTGEVRAIGGNGGV